MKKTTTALILTFAFQGMMAQENNEHPHLPPRAATEVDTYTRFIAETDKPETPIWSEDFANGLPAAWSTSGSSDSALWEYRGPATTPNNTVGSRGAYAGTTGPIQSPTASNGFMIFDSDYLDNDGIVANYGQGKAPAAHRGYLTSGTINLTGEPLVELRFNSYARKLKSEYWVLFSTDDGQTWTDSIEVHSNIWGGMSTAANEVITLNVSSIIGNQANVRIRFTYAGKCIGSQPCGYYFWMIDDVEINVAPRNSLSFAFWAGGTRLDVYTGPRVGVSSKSGHMALGSSVSGTWDQTREMAFLTTAINTGYDNQNNVKLEVDILDGNNNVVATKSSTSIANLGAGQSAQFNTQNDLFTPTNVDDYKAVYKLISDSTQSVDTLNFYVTDDRISNDFGYYSSMIGTPDLGDDGSGVATRIDISDAIQITHVWVGLASQTQAGGELEIEIYDTTEFDLLVGFIPSRKVGESNGRYTITASDVAQGFCEIPVKSFNPDAVNLSPQGPGRGGYYVVAKMYSDQGANPVFIKNDNRVEAMAWTRMMYLTNLSTNPRWYLTVSTNNPNNLWIRPKVNHGISVDEVELHANLRIGPNPTSGLLHVMFDRLPGQYNLTLTDLSGREVLKESLNISGPTRHTLDLGHLPKGMYVLSVENGKASVRYKVVVE